MICRFKFYGKYFAFDTKSATVHNLSELMYNTLTYLRFPLESEFPTTLRYDLAKYESAQLKEAYSVFKKWNADGVFESDAPTVLPTEPTADKIADKTVTYDGKKFVFASEVIKSADAGAKVVSATEDTSAPVKESDYDILFSEYERVAKELIKRKSGRIPGDVFEFLPFSLPFKTDDKGYCHITAEGISELFESDKESIARKITELAVAVFME